MYRPNKDNRPLFAPLGPLECRSQYLGTYSLIRRTKVFVFPSYAYITKSSQICPRLKTGSRFSKTRRWDPPSPSQKVDYLWRCPTGEVQNRQARAAAVAKSVCGTLGVLSVGALSISRDTIFHGTVAVSPFFSAVLGHGYVL